MRPTGPFRAALILLAALAAAAGPRPSTAAASEDEAPPASGWSGNLNVFGGAKFLDADHWEPVEDQWEAGLAFDFRPWRLPLNLAIDLLYSRDEADVDVEVLNVGRITTEVVGETAELDLGVRAIWERPRFFRPFFGGGFGIVRAKVEARTGDHATRDADTALGVWLDAGAYVTLAGRWNLGVDGRWSWAQADLAGVAGDAGGWHLGALAGVHW